MFSWLISNLATILISLVLVAIVVLIILKLRKDKCKGKSSCGCNCAHCAMAGVLNGNLGALILRCALRLGRALHRHGAYFPSLSSTTS